MKNKKYLIILSMLLLFTACESNSDNTEKKLVANMWLLETYLRNGNDETDQIAISNYRENYNDDGTFERSYFNIDGNLVEETGSWNFKNNEKEIHVSDISSIRDFSSNNSTLSSSIFNIVMLTDNRFRYDYLNGGDNHEFQFIQE